MERALETIELFAHFCRATGITDVRPVATSAIRDATNRKDFLRQARKRSGLEIEVLSPEEEARYGYLAAVNSTTLSDGVALDLGGGSLQLTSVDGPRRARRPLVAARRGPHDGALPRRRARQAKQLKALRAHITDELGAAGWLNDAGEDGARLAGIGGTVRNLAAAAEIAAEQAVVRRPGLRARAQGARRARRALRRHEPARSAARCRASSPSAAT